MEVFQSRSEKFGLGLILWSMIRQFVRRFPEPRDAGGGFPERVGLLTNLPARPHAASILIILLALFHHIAVAQPGFVASIISSRSGDLFPCDLDGDGLADLVTVDGTNLSFFFQGRDHKFPLEPHRAFTLPTNSFIIWSSAFGSHRESVLLMSGKGVSRLVFAGRSEPPVIRPIIERQTILPDSKSGDGPMRIKFSASTGGDWPLILLPAAGGVEIWRHAGDAWERAQTLDSAFDSSQRPMLGATPGLSESVDFQFCLADVNGDHRDDLILCNHAFGSQSRYTLLLQTTDDLFSMQPAMVCTNHAAPYEWLSWMDLNRDGHVDLVKGIWLDEPSFIPGISSGKVIVSIYMADASGRIPSEPTQVFRKNDWNSAVPLTDIDGDGLIDLPLGYNPIDTREGIRKEFTARQLDFNIRVHFLNRTSGFSKEPDCQTKLLFHLDNVDLVLGSNQAEFFQQFVMFDADFDGDGRKDLLVRDKADAFSVYPFISRQKGYSSIATIRFPCPEGFSGRRACDLNGDGVSDLILRFDKRREFRIFVSDK